MVRLVSVVFEKGIIFFTLFYTLLHLVSNIVFRPLEVMELLVGTPATCLQCYIDCYLWS